MIRIAPQSEAPEIHLRKLLLIMSLVAALALPAQAQDDPVPVNPVTMGKGPKEGEKVPAWIFYWLLGIGSVVSGALVLALGKLWVTLQDERKAKDAPGLTAEEHAKLTSIHEIVTAKDVATDVPRIYSARALPDAITKLTELAQDTLERLEKLGDAREDRQVMRGAFDAEKAQMRTLYTNEIKGLQERLTQEQRERREETQELWKKNDGTTREVMTVIRDMIIALENASKTIEQYHEAEE